VSVNPLSLFTIQGADKILRLGLEIGAALGLPVTSWAAGDPTRACFKYLAEVLETYETATSQFVKSAFLSYAEDDWLKLLAEELYGLDPETFEPTFATPTITLSNTGGGGNYPLEPGELTVRNSETDKTYHNTNSGTISPGLASITFDLVADEGGSDSSVGANEIDEFVTQLNGVTIVSNTVGLANDAPSNEEIRTLCRTSLGALSPNGPLDAYEHIALNSTYTGVTGINRARAVASTNGTVTVTIATVTGPADGAAVTAVQDAVERWAAPLTTNPTVVSAAAETANRNVTVYRLASLTQSEAQIEAAIEAAYGALFAATPIGGVDGEVSESAQTNAIHQAFPNQFYKVTGATAIALGANEVPVLGTLQVTVL
jgi:hypothetical protein